MNFLVALFVLFAWCAIQVASDTNYVVTFDAHAPITELIYTLNTPATSPDPTNSGNSQGIWAGILTADGQTLFQNVVESQDDGPHSWAMKPAYCCNPYAVLNAPEQVYRGDSLQISLVDNTHGDGQTPQWVNSIYIARNPADVLLHPGLPLAVRPYSATIGLETSKYPVPSPLTQAMFTIELRGSGTWDWGEVVWQDIYIQALTTDSDWCTHPFANSNFAVALDAPVVTVNGEYTLCYIEHIYFYGPS